MNPDSYWLTQNKLRKFPKLDDTRKVDVVVIGGGIAGVTAAYLLKRAGLTVALLERDRCGRANTGHTTAHLTYVTDTRLSDLVQTFGRDHAQAAWDAGAAAIQLIHDIIGWEKIDCDFAWVPAYLHAPRGTARREEDARQLQAEATLARDLGFDANFMDLVPLVGGSGIRFGNQAKFDPLKYLNALLGAIPGEGCHVFEKSEVVEFSDQPRGVQANGHWVHADYIVITTHVPLQGQASTITGALFQSKLASYSTYAIGARLPAGVFTSACFWDTATPYDYLRIDRGDVCDYAIFGGEDHKTGQTGDEPARFDRLAQRLHAILPSAEIEHQWSGQVVETNDGLPLIGEITDQQFIATGFAGNGMTFGTVAAIMACDAAKNRRNPWSDLFDVRRKKLGSAWDYVKENIDYPYYMVKDLLTGEPDTGTDSLQPGEANILSIDKKRVACYRDDAGKLHAVSPVCTHMGCLVHWNAAEHTWDCPCHGSRFQPDGAVVAGPAEKPLAKVEVVEKRSTATAGRQVTTIEEATHK